MSLLKRRVAYDRARILDAAAKARAKRRRHRAISLYRRVLIVERDNPELHAKIAPLLAETGQHFDAWQSFRLAGRDFVRSKRYELALATYREATRCLPQQVEAWQSVARLERKLHGQRPATESLLEGRRRLRSRRLRPQAIALLRSARQLDPADLSLSLDLARLLSRNRQREEAQLLLERLAERCEGSALRRVRGAQWRMCRSLQHSWLWLRAATAALGEPESSAGEPAGAPVPLSRPLAPGK